MTALADGFRREGGTIAGETLTVWSELRTPMVALGVFTRAHHDNLLESEHGSSFR